MHYDVISIRAFYAGRLGQKVFTVLSASLSEIWPASKSDRKTRICAIGYGVPYLEKLWADVDITALMPAKLGVHCWMGADIKNSKTPANRIGNKAALIDEPNLPLADNSIDQILLIHSLEQSSDAAMLLHEVRRSLVPGGRLLVVVPNRLGWWSRSEKTSWGSGQPFSAVQIRTLLQDAELVPVRWTSCLFLPPSLWQAISTFSPRLLDISEKLGRFVFKRFCGLTIIEAEKLVHAPVKGRKSKFRRPAIGGKPAFVPNARSRS